MTSPTPDPIKTIEQILHDFAVSESLREATLADKLKRGVITADEFDDRLVENYRENLKNATQKEQLLDRLDEAIGEDEIDLTELDGYTITVDVATQLRAVLTKEREK